MLEVVGRQSYHLPLFVELICREIKIEDFSDSQVSFINTREGHFGIGDVSHAAPCDGDVSSAHVQGEVCVADAGAGRVDALCPESYLPLSQLLREESNKLKKPEKETQKWRTSV